MNFKLSENVYFGDWCSPIELKDTVKTIINVGHRFSERKGRDVYWANLERIPWDIYYVRLAQKDRREVTFAYCQTIENSIINAQLMGKLPILCHCQMGSHRGPTTGILATWVLNGRKRDILETFENKVNELRPSYARTINLNYRKTMREFMIKNSV